MSLSLLINHFDIAIRKPEDVDQLKQLILQLAVRGRLVPQDPADEPVDVLLKKTIIFRQEYSRDKKRGNSNRLSDVATIDGPYPLPHGWIWVRLSDISVNRDGERIPLSGEVRELRRGPYPYYGASGIIDNLDDYLFDKPLLLIGEDGANLINRSTPIAFIAEGKYWVNNHAHVLDAVEYGVLEYLRTFINAIDLKPYVTGTAQPKMNQAKMNSIPIALPPTAEQRRIVARVDELLAAADDLAGRLAAAGERRRRYHTAALARLTSEKRDTKDEIRDTTDDGISPAPWPLLESCFDRLYSDPAAVGELKQTILQLAVMGRLVAQDAADEPAGVLLERIGEEQRKRANKLVLTLSEPVLEEPFSPVSLGWKWARFQEIAEIASNLKDPRNFGALPHIAPNNIESGSGRLLYYRTVQEDDVRSSNHHFFPGQIIYSKIRPNLSKAVIVDFEGLCSADMYPLNTFINPRFLLLYILSSTFVTMATKNDTRVAMPKINQTELN